MRALIQRVTSAQLTTEEQLYSQIDKGLLVLLGVEDADETDDVEWLASKISKLRIFDDENGVMNLSALDVAADVMVVSQFTLHARTKKGSRPSYIKAAKPEHAVPMYEQFVKQMSSVLGKEVKTGKFGAQMDIELTNSGPVTIWIDTKSRDY